MRFVVVRLLAWRRLGRWLVRILVRLETLVAPGILVRLEIFVGLRLLVRLRVLGPLRLAGLRLDCPERRVRLVLPGFLDRVSEVPRPVVATSYVSASKIGHASIV